MEGRRTIRFLAIPPGPFCTQGKTTYPYSPTSPSPLRGLTGVSRTSHVRRYYPLRWVTQARRSSAPQHQTHMRQRARGGRLWCAIIGCRRCNHSICTEILHSMLASFGCIDRTPSKANLASPSPKLLRNLIVRQGAVASWLRVRTYAEALTE